ncbi:MAG: alpha/beta fold hydrolase [Coriobacteriia bacterium]
MRKIMKILGIAVLVALLLVSLAATWFVRPLGSSELRSKPSPAADYAESLRRFDAVELAEETMNLQDVGDSYAFLHGSRVETAVVIFHGYTDVPDQFLKVAEGYFNAGANVFVPRMPFHGYADRMTDDLSQITPELLRAAADENIDIAAGLGTNIEVVGFSGGGAIAAWAAAERPDVDRTIIISPLMLPKGYKPWMIKPMARVIGMLPDTYTWWNDEQAESPGPEYPRYSKHGITSYLMMVERAKADGQNGERPVEGDVVMVSNLSDQHLDTQYPMDVMRPLMSEGAGFHTVTIPVQAGLLHDIVGLTGDNRPKLRVAYGFLSDAIGIRMPDPLGIE